MNLLVGVVCEGGVVVGSAGSGADRGTGPSEVTFTVRDDLVLASSGRAGLGRRFGEVVAAVRSDSRFQEWTGLTIAKMICAEVRDDFASTRADEAKFGALLAYSACDGVQLCEFAPGDLQPELKHADRCFAVMGAGRALAEPFTRFLRRVLFADALPTLQEGVFAATWILHYTLGASSVEEPDPVRIAVLPQENAGLPPIARLVTAEESREALATVREAEKHLTAYRRNRSAEAD